MLFFLFVLGIIIFFLLSIYATFKMNSKFAKAMTTILLILFAASVFIFGSVAPKGYKDATISTIEIAEVYKDEVKSYCIRKSADDELAKITIKNVYKGDSNYLIRYEYPNMTNTISFLIYSDKVEYDLVVTDLNIPELNSMN